MKTPSGYKYSGDNDMDLCIVCGIQMPNADEPTCSIECEEEREQTESNNDMAKKAVVEKAESGDFIQITKVSEADDFQVGDIFEVDLRFSSMGACDDDSLMTCEEHVVMDEQYVIHKRRYPSEEALRQEVLDKVGSMSFERLKALANHLLI